MEANAWLFFCRKLLTQFLSVSLFILTGKDFFSVSLSCGFDCAPGCSSDPTPQGLALASPMCPLWGGWALLAAPGAQPFAKWKVGEGGVRGKDVCG